MKRLSLIAAFVSASTMAATPVLGDGVLSAVAYKPVPAGAAIFVRPLDNSDHNLVLLADIERALKDRGYTLSQDAALVLTFETRDTAGSWTGGGPNRFVELSNNHDQTGVNAPRVQFNLFNSQRGGILNPDRREPTRTVTPSELRIDVTIDSKTGGERLWQGWSSVDIGPGDPQSLARTMIPALVDSVGKTISHKAFPVK